MRYAPAPSDACRGQAAVHSHLLGLLDDLLAPLSLQPTLTPGSSLVSSGPFKMSCPKCGSKNVDLEEDQRAYLGGGRHQVQLHCYTCGHIIYGEQRIQAECDRQYVAWQSEQRPSPAGASAGEASQAPAPAPAPAPDPTASPAAQSPTSPPAPGAQEAAEADGASSKKAKARKPRPPEPVPPEGEEEGRATGQTDPETGLEITVPVKPAPLDKKGRPLQACHWPPCARYARANSKYCSRNCSNKNARARYARRNVKG